MIDLRLPNITGTTDREQLTQMKSYMHQLVEQLNFALNTIDTIGSSASPSIVYTSKNGLLKENEKPVVDSTATFNAIKGLIIKSADIVEAYYQEIERQLKGVYVAQSDFGTYMEETELTIGETSTNITEFYKSYKTVEGQVNLNTTTLGYVKTGKLDEDKDGYDIVGIEIGEKKQDSNNEEVFNKFARFTSDKLSFFDDEGEEVAYVSDKRFKMIDAEIEGTLYWGAYKITRSYGLAFKRIGRG